MREREKEREGEKPSTSRFKIKSILEPSRLNIGMSFALLLTNHSKLNSSA